MTIGATDIATAVALTLMDHNGGVQPTGTQVLMMIATLLWGEPAPLGGASPHGKVSAMKIAAVRMTQAMLLWTCIEVS